MDKTFDIYELSHVLESMKKEEKMHTKEPWQWVGSDGIKDSTGKFWIASLHSNAGELSPLAIKKANAQRIVAAVNACAGIPTNLLEQNIISPAMAVEIKQQRDELLDGCKALLGLLQLICARDDVPASLAADINANHRAISARAAIAKCEAK